ncbi:MAG: DUF4954 family protein [Bacteroidales bacterium]|nr:DUF4954 family protein [Bacteroidales bacterium]
MYRNLTDPEVALLQSLGNFSDNWQTVYVSDPFDASLLHFNHFSGEVFLGSVSSASVSVGDISFPEGIYHSWLRNCVVGHHCAVHQVRLLDNCEVGDKVLIFNVGQISSSRPFQLDPIAVMNENGRRSIIPFPSMTVGDAYLWAKYRNQKLLQHRLAEFTSEALPPRATIGEGCVLSNCQKIHNTIILSDADAPTVISEAIALENGIVGYGCQLSRGCVLRNFLLGENVHIEDVARINDSVIGDNSTIARCEVGNSLVFPAHEQHHNNSFLIAATLMGQTNLAAGTTIGSNHNGRTADNEFVSGRGFWPGLCSSFKHPSRLASYCLFAKGDYPNELNIILPFSLVNNNAAKDCLEVMPAYWWMYNMYALHRNEKKFAARDRRNHQRQHIEFSPLAPDTVEEIVYARQLIRNWTEQAYLHSPNPTQPIEITADEQEHGRRKVVLLKAAQGYRAYEDMIYYYIGCVLVGDSSTGSRNMPDSILAGRRETVWINIGGQLIPQTSFDQMLRDIEQGKLDSWSSVHGRMDALWQQYPDEKRRHAYRLLCDMMGISQLTEPVWEQALSRYDEACRYVTHQVRSTREKDEKNPFRRMIYADDAEMNAVLY